MLFLDYDRLGCEQLHVEYPSPEVMRSHRLALEFQGWHIAGQELPAEDRVACSVVVDGQRYLVPIGRV